jgi:hypothetical protein
MFFVKEVPVVVLAGKRSLVLEIKLKPQDAASLFWLLPSDRVLEHNCRKLPWASP